MRHSPAIVQVADVPLLLPPKKAEAGETCPQCGGPAEVDLFWSTSPENPGQKVLKKQICCGGRPGRNSRYRTSPVTHCPVQVMILEQAEVVALASPPEPNPEPDLSLTARLDAAVELLALLSEAECLQLVEAARLTRELCLRKQALKASLQRP